MALLLAACAGPGATPGQPTAQAAAVQIDPRTGLATCPENFGVLPSRGGEGVQQSASSLPPGFKDGSQGCIYAQSAARATEASPPAH
jgi:hypothetical protein